LFATYCESILKLWGGAILYQLRSRVKGGAGIDEKYRVATAVFFFQKSFALLARPDVFQQPRRIAILGRIDRPSVDGGVRLGLKERRLSSSTPHCSFESLSFTLVRH
jgi:hypothetical protein